MKNNKKGFTLVELIIVSTIMVMIMGAILNFIQPMNRFYTRTVYNSDANDVGSLLQDKIEADVRYATSICILEGYEGVPVIKDHYLRRDDGTKSLDSLKFTDVMIVDNNSFRGKIYDSYSEDNTVAHRKGATGSILRAPINDDGIDMDKLEILGGEDLYSDMKCEFETYLSVNDSTKNKCLTLSSKFWRPEYENGQYEFNKLIFNQVRDFELVNINLTDPRYEKYDVNYFTTRTDANDPIKYQAYELNYKQFANETAGSSTPGINEMYTHIDDHGRNLSFTYIFYTKSVPDDSKVNVTFKYEDGFPFNGAILSTCGGQLKTGSVLPASWINTARNQAKNDVLRKYSDGADEYVLTFDDFYIDGKVPYSTAKNTPIMNDTDVVLHFTKRKLLPPNYHVYFYDQFDKAGNWLGTHDTANPYGVVPIYNPATTDGNEYLDQSEVSNPSGNAVHEFDSWNTMPDGSGSSIDFSVDSQIYITGDTEYYAIYKAPADLEFRHDDDTTIDHVVIAHSTKGSDVASNSEYVSNILPNVSIPSGKVLCWDVYDASGNSLNIELENMTDFPDDNYIIKARLEDPSPKIVLSKDNPQYWGNEECNYNFKLKNTGTAKGTDIDVTVTFTFPNKINTLGSWWGDLNTYDSSTCSLTKIDDYTLVIKSKQTFDVGQEKETTFNIKMDGIFVGASSVTVSY